MKCVDRLAAFWNLRGHEEACCGPESVLEVKHWILTWSTSGQRDQPETYKLTKLNFVRDIILLCITLQNPFKCLNNACSIITPFFFCFYTFLIFCLLTICCYPLRRHVNSVSVPCTCVAVYSGSWGLSILLCNDGLRRAGSVGSKQRLFSISVLIDWNISVRASSWRPSADESLLLNNFKLQ